MKVALMIGCLAVATSPALAQDAVPVWQVTTPKDAPATLVYGSGTPQNIQLTCNRKSGEITLILAVHRRLADHKVGQVWVDGAGVPAPWPASVKLLSGTASATLRGQAQAAPNGTQVTTDVSTNAPVLKAFAKTGAINLTSLAEPILPTLAKPGMVRKFIGFCK